MKELWNDEIVAKSMRYVIKRILRVSKEEKNKTKKHNSTKTITKERRGRGMSECKNNIEDAEVMV